VGRVGNLRTPASSLAGVIARHSLSDASWLVMDIEGMELGLARRESAALRHFAGIIVECHDVEEGGRRLTHEQVLAEMLRVGFDLVARRGKVSVLRRRG
jgi:hypothetical protein